MNQLKKRPILRLFYYVLPKSSLERGQRGPGAGAEVGNVAKDEGIGLGGRWIGFWVKSNPQRHAEM